MAQPESRPQASILRQVAANGGWWLAERFGLLALTLLTSIVVVRALGPSAYGELSYVLALTGLLAPLAQFGVSGLVARALLERPGDDAAVLRAALVMRLAGCAVAFLVGLGWWAWFESQPATRWVVLVLLAAQFATAFQVVEFWFQVQYKAAELVPWRTGVNVLAALLKMAVAAATHDPVLVAVVFAIEYLLGGAASLLALRRAGGMWVRPGRSPEWTRWFARRSPWLLASGVAEVIYLRIDIVLLERLRGVQEAGIYAVAARLSEVWYMVPVALMGAVFPALWSRRDDPRAYERSLQGSLDALCALALGLAVFMQFAGRPLVEFLFGARFSASTTVLQIHIWAGVFIFMRALLSRWLLAEDLLRFSLVTHVAGAVINVVLNFMLIPAHGAAGAAIATVISYASAGWLALFLSARTRPMGWMMARSLLLPLRWGDLADYARRVRSGLHSPGATP
ncbi:MAG: flippase [Gammaproteobacteria bacterium]|nr:flippase [Gammaproteobacteria bacterium]